MPLYKRKPFHLAKNPEDLKPREDVFQVRFTNEIFRDYGEYLNRVNLYRQRVWTCKVTGKTNLTYEEALVYEKRASEKIQQLPKELVAPMLHEVQFSMLPMKDLVGKVAAKLLDHLPEGDELHGKRNNRVYPCKIIKVIEEKAETETTKYEVAWLDKDNKIAGNFVLIEEDLVRKKFPFSKDVLKYFIRQSTYHSFPWVLHEYLARKHGISTDLPDELKSNFVYKDGLLVANKKRSLNRECQLDNGGGSRGEVKRCRNKRMENKSIKEPIKYPIDDLLVRPTADDPVFTNRPSPSKDFNVPMDWIGDLLMIWDFCCSFGRLLHLYPFSLEDFEGVLCYKDSNSVLIMESHSALLHLLIKDEGEYNGVIQNKKLNPKINVTKWKDYLCEFLEMINIAELCPHIRTIRRGHYGLLDIRAKLGILRELIGQALNTTIVREKLDEYIKQRKALRATKRGKEMEAAKRKREDNECVLVEIQNRKKVHTKEPKIGGKQETDVEAAVGDKEDSAMKTVQKLARDDMEKVNREQRKKDLESELEKRFIRTSPLGEDRDHNRYWFFRHDERIFVENWDSSLWGYYSIKEELDAFMGSLNSKGQRERQLKKQIEKYYDRISKGLQKRSKEVARNMTLEDADVRRSTRIQAPPRENPGRAFLKYINKWKKD